MGVKARSETDGCQGLNWVLKLKLKLMGSAAGIEIDLFQGLI